MKSKFKKIGEEIGESGNVEYIKSWLKIILYMNIPWAAEII